MSYPRLTAVSIADYAEWASLPKSRDALTSLVEIFEQAGCEVEHRELLQGGDNAEIADTLNTWLTGSRGGTLMLFWAGHGVRDGDHFLACANSPKTGLSQFNAISSEGVGEAIAKSGAERILVVLDACHSGAGAGELASAFAGALARIPKGGGDPTISVLASSHAFEKAVDGRFLELMQEALTAPSARRVWRDTDEYLEAFHVAKAIKSLADDKGEAVFVSSSDSGGSRDFIPNPRFRHVVGTEDVETRREQDNALDGLDHFNLAAKGIEVGETGWYFSGRARLLRELTDWLTHADSGIAVVTGPPGSGKSAVVGRLVTLSTPQLREAAASVGVLGQAPDGTLPPEGIIDIAIHAKGKTLDDCWRVVSNGLGFEGHDGAQVDVEAVLDQISALDRRLTIVVDALDEAAQGQGAAIAQSLIVPLGHLTNVRLLVGTRRSLDGAVVPEDEERHGRLHRVFGRDAIIHDLSDEQDTSDDIVAYVEHRLSASRADHALDEIRRAANAVAVEAGDVFLYARVVSRTLQEQATFNTDHLPDGAMAAFELDLKQRFEGNETCVDEMLTALAFGLGRGFSRRAWAPVATALSQTGSTYTAEDVSWMLDHAGWHIVEASVETQNSTHGVYRLVHQAFADHYSERMLAYLENDAAIQRRITEALINTIDNDGPITGKQWLQTDRYIWRHLADHAAQCEMLDTLISDPGYLAVAEPNRLLRQLHSVRTNEARPYADIYRRTVDRLHDITPVERMPYIHLVAQMEHPELAPTLEPPVPTKWKCQWAKAQQTTPHQIIGRNTGRIRSIVSGDVEGRAVVVSGDSDGHIQRWDVTTGEAIGRPLNGPDERVSSVAFGSVGGRAVIAAVGFDGTIPRWDAATGEAIGTPIIADNREVYSLAIGSIDGRSIIFSGGHDGTVRRWNTANGEAIGDPLDGHQYPVTSIALGTVDGQILVITSGAGGAIQRWDAASGKTIGAPLGPPNWNIKSIALGTVNGRTIVVSGDLAGKLWRWDAATGKTLGQPIKVHNDWVSSVAVGNVDGRAVIVSGSRDGTIRRSDAVTGKDFGRPLEGHHGPVNAVALGTVNGRTFIASGGDDGTIRRWYATTRNATRHPLDGRGYSVTCLVSGIVQNRSVVVSGDYAGNLQFWDAVSGEDIGRPLEGHLSAVQSITMGTAAGRAVIVSGSWDGTVRCWDVTTGEAIGYPFKHDDGSVNSVALIRDGRRTLIVACGAGGTVSLLDAVTGEVINHPTKTDDYLATSLIARGTVDGSSVVVSGDYEGNLQRWDAATGKAIGHLLEGHNMSVNCVALGTVDRRPILVSGGDDRTVRRWDAATSQAIGGPLEGQDGRILSVALGTADGYAVIIAGDEHGTVRRWDAITGKLISTLELGGRVAPIEQSKWGMTYIAVGTSILSIM